MYIPAKLQSSKKIKIKAAFLYSAGSIYVLYNASHFYTKKYNSGIDSNINSRVVCRLFKQR